MKKEDENCDDKLKIVNRNRQYTVSKKFICSSVPYFGKMCFSDLLKSKVNKVELDFDEHIFDSILSWIHTGLFIMQMDHVIRFYEAADYLMINGRLYEPCLSYFHTNFTIEYIPPVLSQVTKGCKLIDSGSIENFICRHFLKIASTDIFLNYPVETIEAILKLDLVVNSEYQIFESIKKWINKNSDFKEGLFPQLLKCIRWSFMFPVDLHKLKDNEIIKSSNNIDSTIPSSKSDIDRSKQNFSVSIHRIDDSRLRINVFDKELFCLPIGDFTLNNGMSLALIHGEHASDILFDSGRKGIRVDWMKKTFRWHDFKVTGKTYYSQINESILKFPTDSRSFICYLENSNIKMPTKSVLWDEFVFLEANAINDFILIGKNKDEPKWFGSFYGYHRDWLKIYKDHQRSFHATVLDNVVYILTKNLEFIQFNYETKCFTKSEPFKGEKWNFNDLILTSHQTNDDKVYLVNKLSGKISFFCINQKKWIKKLQIMNTYSVNAGRLIAFTSTFLSLKKIKPLYNQNLT
ncbi:uncharacterized protein LOC107360999 isoform X3 [Tetranychus urticae]|uniref:uncharacterized protein LOC107360999 isoform X3 n=1 Tax=Tetranychus urticae TaxID=32264 RepID=UPI00077BD569|nr:uncharacterized protein LOC107360999 isoform X3 [Tetranychus urticae]